MQEGGWKSAGCDKPLDLQSGCMEIQQQPVAEAQAVDVGANNREMHILEELDRLK